MPRTVRTDAAFSEQRRLIGICAFVLVERLVHGMLGARCSRTLRTVVAATTALQSQRYSYSRTSRIDGTRW